MDDLPASVRERVLDLSQVLEGDPVPIIEFDVGELLGLPVWRLRNVLDPGARWRYHQYT